MKVIGRKIFILRRKIHGKSILAKVGNVADFTDISLARKRAAEMARQMVETGRNPNNIVREKAANELTLGDALAAYREHLINRARLASPGTLRVYDRVCKKMAEWSWNCKKMVDFTPRGSSSNSSSTKTGSDGQRAAFQMVVVRGDWVHQAREAHGDGAAAATGACREPIPHAGQRGVLSGRRHCTVEAERQARAEAWCRITASSSVRYNLKM
ncbi:MAG: hypothetical protein ACYC22_02905 [Thiomonas delicata]